MRKYRNLLSMVPLFLLLLLLPFQMALAESSWTLNGDATGENGTYTLTASEYKQAGALSKIVPLDTRQGFTLSFQYYVGDYKDEPRDGFQIVFAEGPVYSGGYYANFGYDEYIFGEINYWGIAFDARYKMIKAQRNRGANTFPETLCSVKMEICDSQWHEVTVCYADQKLQVFQDGVLALSYGDFCPPEMAYLGFTASTFLYAFGCETHMVRNISLQAQEASLLRLDANGGACSVSSLYALSQSSGSLPSPERAGYTFAGWGTSASGGTVVKGLNYSFGAEKTLYAQWKPNTYTVKLDGNGGKSSSKKVVYGKAYGSLPSLKRTGYRFSGWYTAKSGGSRVTASKKVSTSGNHTLYAHWTPRTYRVTFKPNGGSVSTKYKDVSYGKKLGSLPTPKRTGYTFLGWYTKKSGGKKITSSTTMKQKVTYYAHWAANTKKLTIKLNKNGGSCGKSSLVTTYGGKLGGLPAATRSGYTFQGWYTEKDGGTKVSASTKASSVLDTKTLYAHWEKRASSSGSSSGGSTGSSGGSRSSLPCIMCDGSGRCSTCGGDGYRWSIALDSERLNCYRCNGSGRCTYCGGTGRR